MIAPPDSENERVSCCCQKTCWPKAKKRGASRDVHARYLFELATTPSVLGAGRGREYEGNCARVDNITRKHLRMRASNSPRFCDNAEGFARMCLILDGRGSSGTSPVCDWPPSFQ